MARRRLRIWTIALVVALLGVVVAVVLITVDRGREVDLHAEAQSVLVSMTKGEGSRVYDEAAPFLRESVTRARFVELGISMREHFGELVAVEEVPPSRVGSSRFGATATAHCRVRFEKATTSVDVSFLEVAGVWRTIGVRASVPTQLEAAVAAELEAMANREAPAVLLERAQELVSLLRREDLSDAYELTSTSFRETVTEQELTRLIRSREKLHGKLSDQALVVRSSESRGRERAQVILSVFFGRVSTTLAVDFVDESDVWRVSALRFSQEPQ